MKLSSLFFVLSVAGLTACGDDRPAAESEGNGRQENEREVLYWVAPMDPSYRRDEPGKSPMGMDLVPVYADEQEGDVVTIPPAVINNLGVRTAEARREDLPRMINTVGYVGFDESRLTHVHPRTDGWIEALYVRSEGERVEKGDKLFELYSPTLVNAQEEFLQALNSGNRGLIRASRDRLAALGVSEDQIARLRETRQVEQYVTIYARQAGVVAALRVREGMYVQPGTEMMSLADLSTVWVLAEVFESQVDWVSRGQPARVRLSFLPGREWEGEVEYVYPRLDPVTRTLKVRLRFDNPQELLKPNMYADVSVHGNPRRDAVVVPREAVIRTGQADRVVLAVGEGRFISREVTTGMESGGRVVIDEGVSPGDRVVTSAQFLIDSEASLAASMARMSEPPGQKADAPSDGDPADATAAALEKSAARGTGTVETVDPQTRTVTLEHEPIPALGWPEMSMEFSVAQDVQIEGVAIGDRVAFTLEEVNDGYRINALQEVVVASGTVQTIQPDERTVTLEHGPIPELDWPQMTMEFAVDEAVPMESFEEGQAIEFDLREGSDGHIIAAVRASDPKEQ